MNVTVLTGRLTKDPVITRSDSGKTLARFTLAVDREYKKDQADFITCKAFDKTAELIGQYFGKGHAISIQGRIQTGSYDKDGVRVYTTDVIVNRIEFPMGKNQSRGDAYEPGTDPGPDEPEQVDDDDDLPF